MLAYGVPQSIALAIFRLSTISEVNWGAFINESDISEDIKLIYKEIDI